MTRKQIEAFTFLGTGNLNDSYYYDNGKIYTKYSIYLDEVNDISYQILNEAPLYRCIKNSKFQVNTFENWIRLQQK